MLLSRMFVGDDADNECRVRYKNDDDDNDNDHENNDGSLAESCVLLGGNDDRGEGCR